MCVRWNRNYFYSSISDARPNHFVCISGRNATQASYATLPQVYIVNWFLDAKRICHNKCLLQRQWLYQAPSSSDSKYKKSRCFKNFACTSHPVSYYNQQHVWVTAPLFTNWFHQTFVPTVQAKLVDLGLEPKAAPDRQSLCSS